MMRALFYRGRHHLRASLLARPFDERPRVTVSALVERIRRERIQRESAVFLEIRCDVEGMSSKLRSMLDQHRGPAGGQIGAPA